MYHIAQVNIAQLQAPPGDPRVQAFFDNVDRINALAENTDGFVWRYIGEHGNDPLQVFNLSVWENLESLMGFVYRSAHVDIMRRKDEWMTPVHKTYAALWWVPTGHIPSPGEAEQKLAHLDQHGPSESAFTFAERYPLPSTP